MEIFCYFLTLLCASFLNIPPSTASYNPGLHTSYDIPNIRAISSILLQRARRQSDEAENENTHGFTELVRCGLVYHEARCTRGLAQYQAFLNNDCNFEAAERIQQGCMRNSNGYYCEAFTDFNNIGVDVEAIRIACHNSETGRCGTRCRDLLEDARRTVGCCINVLLNTTTNEDPFSYSLWSNCGVEPITEQCEPSSVRLGESDPESPECERILDLVAQRTLESECVKKLLDPIKHALIEVGCELYEEYLLTQCAVDEERNRCPLQETSTLTAAIIKFNSCSGENCTEECKRVLNSTGCCINSIIDHISLLANLSGIVADEREILNNIFTQVYGSCDQEIPAHCEIRLHANLPGLRSSPATTTLVSSYLLLTSVTLCVLFHYM